MKTKAKITDLGLLRGRRMSLMFDVIIVGARCAGAPLAMLLARRGYRVLVVDKT